MEATVAHKNLMVSGSENNYWPVSVSASDAARLDSGPVVTNPSVSPPPPPEGLPFQYPYETVDLIGGEPTFWSCVECPNNPTYLTLFITQHT